MDSSEVLFEFGSFFRAYKDGRVERFFGTDFVPPSTTSPTGVSTKDVMISPETGVSARIFRPAATSPGQKLPLVVYYHGGGFLIGSPFCAVYHNHITSLVNEANIMVLSIDYRLAPEHPVPIAYQDSWAALKWVASHFDGDGPEAWIKEHADFGRLFLAGDSAGGNIVHNMAVQAGDEGLGSGSGVTLTGVCLVHPYFGGGFADKSWRFVCPETSGSGDRRVNPAADPRLARMGCGRVLVCVAENDGLKGRGLWYVETLKSGWDGDLEVFETLGEEHVFHLFNPNCDNAKKFVQKLANFFCK